MLGNKAITNKFPVSYPPDSQKAMREQGKKKHTHSLKNTIQIVYYKVCVFFWSLKPQISMRIEIVLCFYFGEADIFDERGDEKQEI